MSRASLLLMMVAGTLLSLTSRGPSRLGALSRPEWKWSR